MREPRRRKRNKLVIDSGAGGGRECEFAFLGKPVNGRGQGVEEKRGGATRAKGTRFAVVKFAVVLFVPAFVCVWCVPVGGMRKQKTGAGAQGRNYRAKPRLRKYNHIIVHEADRTVEPSSFVTRYGKLKYSVTF